MTQAAQLAQYGANNVGLSFKNRILNGDMTIDQRNGGASGTAAGYTVDRWAYSATQTSKGTWQQNAGSVTPPAGFTNYLGFTSSSAYSVLAGDYFVLRQPIEGLNTADLGFGTANASTVTLSFWVRSSLTGTFGGVIFNSALNRTYVFSYTINVANTWEQKSVTIAGDTTGTWLTNNGIGISVDFTLASGSNFTRSAGSWSTSGFAVTGTTSIVGTNGATFYLTGVQFEKGSVATSFDYLPYGTELMLCQRYAASTFPIGTAWGQNRGAAGCVIISSSGSDTGYGQQAPWRFPVTMRTTPSTITTYNPSAAASTARNFALSANRAISALGFSQNSDSAICFTIQTSTDAVGMAYGIHYSVEAEI
jgi:hypothetical protein